MFLLVQERFFSLGRRYVSFGNVGQNLRLVEGVECGVRLRRLYYAGFFYRGIGALVEFSGFYCATIHFRVLFGVSLEGFLRYFAGSNG